MTESRTPAEGSRPQLPRALAVRRGTLALAIALLLPAAACIGAANDDVGAALLLSEASLEAPVCAPADGAGRPLVTSAAAEPELGHGRGCIGAPVTVYEFSDFGCAWCAGWELTVYPEIHREFVATGQVRWVFVPFIVGSFRNAESAARAGECAAEQDMFWEMKNYLYAGQRRWRGTRQPEEVYRAFAGTIGLESDRFEQCYLGEGGESRTLRNNRTAQVLGVRATPTFLINGRLVEGALPIEAFRILLTDAAAAVD
jgi:protein-disulfide isomerase